MPQLLARRILAAIAAASAVTSAAACTSEDKPDTDPAPATSSAPVVVVAPVEVSDALARYTDAAAAVYDPKQSTERNVAAFKAALAKARGTGAPLSRAEAGTRVDKPTVTLCAQAPETGDVAAYAEQWTVIFTPGGAATEQVTGSTCADLGPQKKN